MKTERAGRPVRTGDAFEGDVLPKLGNGCLVPGPGEWRVATGADTEETGLVLLPDLLRYDLVILVKSSTDLDHVFREISRRSPDCCPLRAIGLDGKLGGTVSLRLTIPV